MVTYTFTVEPTAEMVTRGLLDHAWIIAALVFLSGQLFASFMLADDDTEEDTSWTTA